MTTVRHLLPATDLSNNAGFSAGQQMIVSGNNVYVVWQDTSNGGDFDIFFTVSNDNGQTFDSCYRSKQQCWISFPADDSLWQQRLCCMERCIATVAMLISSLL